jgi:hypothetical protein
MELWFFCNKNIQFSLSPKLVTPPAERLAMKAMIAILISFGS